MPYTRGDLWKEVRSVEGSRADTEGVSRSGSGDAGQQAEDGYEVQAARTIKKMIGAYFKR